MNICVHTAPGWRGESEPRVFFVGGHRLIVASILERWVEHPYHFYEVTCDDGRRFLLCYDSRRQSWELAGVFAAGVRALKWAVASATAPAVERRRWWNAYRKA